jgi:hypothetical protein
MTQMLEDMHTWIDDERDPTASEIEAWQRENTFVPDKEATLDT